MLNTIKPTAEASHSSQINSVPELLWILEKKVRGDWMMFRGQSKNWPLLPGIGRYPRIVKTYENWPVLHEHLLERFLRLGHPHLTGHAITGTNIWVLAQHFGLPTRLLDTSTNPLKALFFSVNEPQHDKDDGVLWLFAYNSYREDLHESHRQYWDTELVPFLPAQLNARLTSQEGSFISYPLPKNTSPLVPLNKLEQKVIRFARLIVPAKAKPHLRNELSTLGIQFRLLFPDLDGVARSIKMTELEF